MDVAGLNVVIGANLEAVNKAMRDLEASLNKAAGVAEKAGDKMSDSLNIDLSKLGSNLQSVGSSLTQYVSVPLAAVGAVAVKTAADFERMGDILQAQTGASAVEMAKVSETARQLGADLTLPSTSAADALKAILELSKGGLTLEQSMSAAKGTIQLASAAQIDNARAAEIQANALNAFGLAASDAARVADLLAGGANKSSASIDELALGFQAGASLARMAGLSIEEFTTSLSLLAKAGIKGSDAGTSIKSMLMALQAPTDKAAAKMAQLGISVFDAQGKMKPFPQIIADFAGALGGLNDKAKADVLSTIFGSDGIRAASIIFRAGPKGFADLAAGVSKTGQAAAAAAAQNKGFYGSLDALKSATETFLQGAAAPFLDSLSGIVRMAAEAVTALDKMPGPVKNTALAMGALAAATGPVLFGVGAVTKAIPVMVSGLTALRTSVLSVNTALAASVVGLAALAAYQTAELFNAPTDADRNLAEQRRFTDEYKKMSKERQDEAVRELVNSSNLMRQRIEQEKKVIQSITETQAALRKKQGTDGSSALNFKPIDPAVSRSIAENEKKLNDHRAALGRATENLNVYQARLNGVKEAAKEMGTSVSGLSGPIDELAASLAGVGEIDSRIPDAIAEIRKALSDAEQKAVVFGNAFDLAGEKTGILTTGLGTLIELGLKPGTRYITEFADELAKINKGAFDELTIDVKPIIGEPVMSEAFLEIDVKGRLTEVSAEGVKIVDLKPFTANDFGLNALGELSEGFKIAEESAKAFGEGYDANTEKVQLLEGAISSLIANGYAAESVEVRFLSEQLDKLNQKQQNTIELGDLVSKAAQGATSAFIDFGVGLATSADSASNLASGLLSSLGDMLISLGKSALMAGLGVEAIKKSLSTLQGAGAIAAGAALIALGALVKSSVKSAASGGSVSRGGGGGGPSSGGTPTTNQPRPTTTSNVTSNIRNGSTAGGNGRIEIFGESRIAGSDLLITFRNAEKAERRTSAGG